MDAHPPVSKTHTQTKESISHFLLRQIPTVVNKEFKIFKFSTFQMRSQTRVKTATSQKFHHSAVTFSIRLMCLKLKLNTEGKEESKSWGESRKHFCLFMLELCLVCFWQVKFLE